MMRKFLVTLVILGVAVAAFAADDAPQAINLTPTLKNGEVSRYNLSVAVKGTVKLPEDVRPIPVDAVLALSVSRTIGRNSIDGITEVIISADAASISMAGQKMDLSKGVFPQMTALVNKNGEVTRLITSDPMGIRLPGINYGNMVLLFSPYAPVGNLDVGTTWKKTVTLPPNEERYDLSAKLVGSEEIKGKTTAKVEYRLELIPPAGQDYSAIGTVTSNFDVDNQKLVKSHVKMVVTSPAGKDSAGDKTEAAAKSADQARCTVTLDIALADAAPQAK